MKYWVIGRKQLVSAGSVLLILLFAALCAIGVLAAQAGGAALPTPISAVERQDKALSLTFSVTGDADVEQILKLLQGYNAKAVFFVSADWVSAYPGRAKELAAAGMELGCLVPGDAGDGAAAENLQFCRQRIQSATGFLPAVYRTSDDHWDSSLLEGAEGCIPVRYSVDSGDGAGDSGVQQIADRVLAGAAGGAIIRMTAGAKYTPAALPFILESLIAGGYEPVSLSRLLWPAPFTVDGMGVQRPEKEQAGG